MPEAVKQVRGSRGRTARILAVSATLCACQLLGTGLGPAGRAVSSDLQGTQFTPVSTYLVVRARMNNEQDAREIGSKLVRDYLSGLGGRVVFVDKDYANITTADCTAPGTCEAIRVSVEEKSYMVTYHIESRLLSSVPDRAIWDEAQPASVQHRTARPAGDGVRGPNAAPAGAESTGTRRNRAQGAAMKPNTAVVPAKVRIYLAGFTANVEHLSVGPTDLNSFVNSYLYLRLSQLTNAWILSEPLDVGCGQEANAIRQATPQSITPVLGGDVPSYYTVRGTLETHPRETGVPEGVDDLVINYEVLKTVRCSPQVLLRRGEPVSQPHFLDSMSVIADSVAYRVREDAAKRIRVDVKTVPEDRSGPEELEFAKSLTDYLVKALATTDDLQPNNADNGANSGAEYALEARVSFPRSANLLRGFARNAEISLYVLALAPGNANVSACSSNPHCYTLSPMPLRGATSQRQQMFESAADLALKGINDVRYAREAGLPKDYSTEQATNRAKQLLCAEVAQNTCTPQTEAAVSLLQKAPTNPDTLEWVGKAQYLGGRYAEAGESYAAALRSASSLPPDAALRLNLEAGEAWYMAQNFNNAAKYYDGAARMLEEIPGVRSDTDFNVQRAFSHRFKGERLEALDDLLHPVEPVKNPEVLQREMEHIVESMAPGELPQAIERLQKEPGRNRGALLQAYESQARAEIARGQNAEAETTLQKALAMLDENRQPTFYYLLSVAQFWELAGPGTPSEKNARYRQIAERLESVVKAEPTGQQYAPLTLQLQVCSDYLHDHDCVMRTIGYLEKAKVAGLPHGVEMDLIEIQVLDKSYGTAVQRLDSIWKSRDLEPQLRTIASFYQVWTSLAENNAGRAEEWFKKWQDSLKNSRKAGPLNWTFGGAGKALAQHTGAITEGEREMLKAMIGAMEDEKAPTVTFRH